jgi:hypothetical protein
MPEVQPQHSLARGPAASGPERCAALFDAARNSIGDWQPEEYAALLEHQLAARIQPAPGLTKAGGVKAVAPAPDWPLTFGALFAAAHPPVALVRQVKEFAKAHRDSPRSCYPRPLATLLYCASIAAALVRCGERITSLSDDQLRQAFAWGLAQSWNREPLVSLLRDAASLLRPAGHPG